MEICHLSSLLCLVLESAFNSSGDQTKILEQLPEGLLQKPRLHEHLISILDSTIEEVTQTLGYYTCNIWRERKQKREKQHSRWSGDMLMTTSNMCVDLCIDAYARVWGGRGNGGWSIIRNLRDLCDIDLCGTISNTLSYDGTCRLF